MKSLEHITAALWCHPIVYLLSSRNSNNVLELHCFMNSKVFVAIKGLYSEERPQNRNK